MVGKEETLLLIYCPQCKTYRTKMSFRRNKKNHTHNWICNKCDIANKEMMRIVDEILEGVKIPYYETPVTKYKITDQNV